jgi:midasin
MDVKVLIGSYICTEIPGEFQWKAGIISVAVEQGHWLLIEDFHLSSSDLFLVEVKRFWPMSIFVYLQPQLEEARNYQIQV